MVRQVFNEQKRWESTKEGVINYSCTNETTVTSSDSLNYSFNFPGPLTELTALLLLFCGELPCLGGS
jgi:hypothetical protein